jgi:hypothetical protein
LKIILEDLIRDHEKHLNLSELWFPNMITCFKLEIPWKKVKKLTLQRCAIIENDNEIFLDLYKLIELDLSDNLLTKFPKLNKY